jgi:hypothetical protein
MLVSVKGGGGEVLNHCLTEGCDWVSHLDLNVCVP